MGVWEQKIFMEKIKLKELVGTIVLMQFSNFSSNILVLDEIFDSLDIKSSNAVINALAKRLTDIESIFMNTLMNKM